MDELTLAIGALPIIGGVLGLGSLINSIRQGNRAEDLQQEALDIQRSLFQQGAPLRRLTTDRLLAMLGQPAVDPNAPDLTAAFQDPTNPFSRPLPRVGERNLVQEGTPQPAPITTPPPPTDTGGALPVPGVRLPRLRGGARDNRRDRELF